MGIFRASRVFSNLSCKTTLSTINYIVAEDLDSENIFIILKDGDIEQIGLLLCDFCGLVCASEEEKYIHQRAHSFI